MFSLIEDFERLFILDYLNRLLEFEFEWKMIGKSKTCIEAT